MGAAEGIAEKTADILQTRHPGLQIAGTYAGSPSPEDADDIIARVNNSNAHIFCLVAYGAPKQDLWIDTYRDQLQVNMAVGIGGAFDYITGTVPRAPQWLRKLGLEWLYRLTTATLTLATDAAFTCVLMDGNPTWTFTPAF